MAVSPAPPSCFQNSTNLSSGPQHDASLASGLGADIPGKGLSLASFPWTPLQPRAHICSPSGWAEKPRPPSGERKSLCGYFSPDPDNLTPSSQAKIRGETQPNGLLVREASGLDFQIPESSLLGPMLRLTSLQGPLMNRWDNGHALKEIKEQTKGCAGHGNGCVGLIKPWTWARLSKGKDYSQSLHL